MKKQIILLVIIFLTTSIIISQTINVTFPRAGNTLWKNSTFHIAWTSRDCTDRNYKINIFRNSIDQANFIQQLTTTNATTIPWTIPMSYSPGRYILRVKTADNVCVGDSAVFSISEPPTIDWTSEEASSPQDTSTPILRPLGNNVRNLNKNLNITLPSSIKINYPHERTNWKLKLENKILPFRIKVEWEKKGIGPQDNYVKIFLKRVEKGTQITLLTQRTRNNGFFRGKIRSDLRSSLYKIIIQTLDGKIRVESAAFHITNTVNDPDQIFSN